MLRWSNHPDFYRCGIAIGRGLPATIVITDHRLDADLADGAEVLS